MAGSFKFDKVYQKHILSMMVQDFTFATLASQYLVPEYFDTEALSWVFKAVRNYLLDYTARPTKEIFKREITKERNKGGFKKASTWTEIKYLYKNLWFTVPSSEYIQKEVRDFVKHQAIKNAMLECVPLLEKDRYDDIRSVMQTAFQAGEAGIDMGTRYFVDYRDRLLNRRTENIVISTGIPELDDLLRERGLRGKEIGLILAPPSIGKTMCLAHIAKAAILRKYKVIVYTLEMSQDIYAERFDTSWSGVDLDSDEADMGRVFKRIGGLHRQFGDALIIKEFPTGSATVQTIQAHLEYVRGQINFVPDLIVVDYAELMRAVNKQSEHRLEIGEIVKELRGLAGFMGVPVWSAVQANRKSLSKQTVTLEDLSESFEPAKHADVVVALCQTAEEREEEIMRMFMAKNRNGLAKVSFPFRTAFERNQFYIGQEGMGAVA